MQTKVFIRPKGLPDAAWKVWESVYEQNKDKGDESAAAIAWTAVKKGWKKDGEKWVKKEASEIELPHTFRGSITDLATMEVNGSGGNVSTIEIMRVGNWNHPLYGEFSIDMERLDRFAQNFNDGVRKAIAIDIEHRSDEGAVGWVRNVFVADKEGINVLMAEVEWTDEGVDLIKKKKYRFFSPEFADEYEDAASGEKYRDVLIGGAITNRPFFQELEEITLSEGGEIKYMKFAEDKKKAEDMMAKAEEMMKSEDPEMKKKGEAMMAKAKEMMKNMSEISRNKKGGEQKIMTYEELVEKLKTDPEFVPTEEDGVSAEDLAKAQAEVAKESDEDGKDTGSEGEGEEGGKDEAKKTSLKINAKKMNDGSVKLTEDQLDKLTKAASEGVKAMSELRRMKIASEVESFVYSISNIGGVLLPKQKDAVLQFASTLGDNQRKAFFEIIKNLPKIKLFGEIGHDKIETEEFAEESSDKLDIRAKRLMSEQPERFKTYREAAFEAEKQLKAEGIEF